MKEVELTTQQNIAFLKQLQDVETLDISYTDILLLKLGKDIFDNCKDYKDLYKMLKRIQKTSP